MKKIPLTRGQFAIIDDENFEELCKFKWYFDPKCGACRHLGKQDGHDYKMGNKIVYMHREIMSAPPLKEVDHINHNKIDNRKANLRLCTPQQNRHNMRPRIGSSIFKGVSKNKKGNKWYVFCGLNNRSYYFGCYEDERHAAAIYDVVAKKLFGEFAFLNFPNADSLSAFEEAYIIRGAERDDARRLAIEDAKWIRETAENLA